MLIDSDDKCYGFFGIGYDTPLAAQARQVFLDKKALVSIFDSRSGNDWETGQDNNAMLRILFEYISPDEEFSTMALIERALETGTRTVLATVVESDIEDLVPGDRLSIVKGECRNPFPEQYLQDISGIADNILSAGRPSLESFITESGSINIFFDIVKPPLHLLIIGTGADSLPLVKLAKFTGWRVTQTDYRDDYERREQNPEPDHRVCCTPEDLWLKIDPDNTDAAIIMTHKYDFDLRYLLQLSATGIPYIGLLGPAAKRDSLMESAGAQINNLQDRVYGPVGLDIGAELPEEVALSIITEIKAVSAGRKAGFLSREPAATAASEAVQGQLYALVLAAGGSRRFDGLKQLVELQGKSLLRRAVDSVREIVAERVVVILGVKAKKLERELQGYTVQIIHNPNWENGIASSIRTGISVLPETCNGVIIIFCDQPFVTSAHLNKLIDNWNHDRTRIVSSSYASTLGVPAIFPKKFFPKLLKLTGDNGAKSILTENRDEVIPVDLPEAEMDIDTQTDLIEAIKRISE